MGCDASLPARREGKRKVHHSQSYSFTAELPFFNAGLVVLLEMYSTATGPLL